MINKFRFRKKSLDDNLLSRKDEIRSDGNGTGTLTKDDKKVSFFIDLEGNYIVKLRS